MKDTFSAGEYREIRKQFTSLLSMKNASEYQPELMSTSDAEKSVKWAERIVSKGKAKTKGLDS